MPDMATQTEPVEFKRKYVKKRKNAIWKKKLKTKYISKYFGFVILLD